MEIITRMQMTKVLWGIFSSNSHIKISPVQISHFSSANLAFLQCQFHISPVPISRFSSANLTFLQCKSHISPMVCTCFVYSCFIYYWFHLLLFRLLLLLYVSISHCQYFYITRIRCLKYKEKNKFN